MAGDRPFCATVTPYRREPSGRDFHALCGVLSLFYCLCSHFFRLNVDICDQTVPTFSCQALGVSPPIGIRNMLQHNTFRISKMMNAVVTQHFSLGCDVFSHAIKVRKVSPKLPSTVSKQLEQLPDDLVGHVSAR